MKIIHTMPVLIRSDVYCDDERMAKSCFESLQASKEQLVVLYNQGCISNDDLREILASCGLPAVILGHGENVGIAQARQACFEHIWQNYGDVEYISEIHVDMVFPSNWYTPLIDFLTYSDEPMISPGIVTRYGELQPIGSNTVVPNNSVDLLALLADLNQDTLLEGFVHPVIHKASILREIGGYDTRFLRGKQGYEDDSLLLGYLYHMGTRTNWRPKCFLKSWVYHATMAQRMSLPDKELDFAINEEGLIRQYGAYGLKELSNIHRNPTVFNSLFQKCLQK